MAQHRLGVARRAARRRRRCSPRRPAPSGSRSWPCGRRWRVRPRRPDRRARRTAPAGPDAGPAWPAASSPALATRCSSSKVTPTRSRLWQDRASKKCLPVGVLAGVVTTIFPCRKALFADTRPRSASILRWIRAKAHLLTPAPSGPLPRAAGVEGDLEGPQGEELVRGGVPGTCAEGRRASANMRSPGAHTTTGGPRSRHSRKWRRRWRT